MFQISTVLHSAAWDSMHLSALIAYVSIITGAVTGFKKITCLHAHLQVKDTMSKFEERLWSLIRNFVELGHNNPVLLVTAVRIVEIQELVDKQLESSGRGMSTACLCIIVPCARRAIA